ncbi:FAD-binding protein [Bacillus sp. EB01]|uniref:FAD-binding protein n=1 Tax=Bacillus sp. EB01 TaxID=1347086 RepID=UPI0005C74F7B|nr:FAD-binding protein [Bacillus sp. EB01]
MNSKIISKKTDTLSRYRTQHYFQYYGEIESIEDYIFYIDWAKKNKKKLFFLGNGSNTLFTRKNVKTLVLKNNLKKEINCISEKENLYEISSNVLVSEVLSYCYKRSLDSFYYLASVPATIGGALAMNAGQGRQVNQSIYDFVESVTYIDSDQRVVKLMRNEMNIEFRKTIFTGCQDKFIIGAVFKFPNKEFHGQNPIMDRIRWAKAHQDNVLPNCGSVFNKGSSRLLRYLKGFRIGKAKFSSKAQNWINNESTSPYPILTLIFITRLLHLFIFKKTKIEVIRVK